MRGIIEWKQRASEERAVKLIRQGVNMVRIMNILLLHVLTIPQRIMTNALRLWTTRVADLKFRELETTQRYQRKLVVCVLVCVCWLGATHPLL